MKKVELLDVKFEQRYCPESVLLKRIHVCVCVCVCVATKVERSVPLSSEVSAGSVRGPIEPRSNKEQGDRFNARSAHRTDSRLVKRKRTGVLKEKKKEKRGWLD